MARGGKDPSGALTESELRDLMEVMQGACDVVRVVDPATFEARTLDDDGGFNEPYACYSALCKGRRCENCISMRAVKEKRPVSKFELVDGDAYFITARPLDVEGEFRTLEMVQKVSDQVGMQAQLDGLFGRIQEETDDKFIDGFTGAYSRDYFDEGLSTMRGCKLAVLEVGNLDRVKAEDGYPAGDLLLKRVAHEILARTRVEDSVIHYEGGRFIIQFEDMESKQFPAVIQRISDAVRAASVDGHPDVHPQVTVAAVDGEGAYGDLAARALDQLADMGRTGERMRILSSEGHSHQLSQVRKAAIAETLHNELGRLAVEIDELTGLRTSTGIRAHLQDVVARRHAREEGFRLVYLDIVNFKQFNRTYGMTGGDMLLKFLADKICAEFPRGTAARMHGDVFLIVTDEPAVEERLSRLHVEVAAYQRKIALELKAGVVELDEACHDATTAIDLAKVACESIKGRYDRIVRFYDSAFDQELSMNEYVVNNIERAIEEGHIKVFYQPIIRTVTGHVCAFECLCRWDDPEHGLLPPGAFIAALERFHLIDKVDACVVRQACLHQAELMAQGKPLVPVTVNLSRLDFQLEDVFGLVEDAVAQAGIPRGLLIIEVTESALDDGGGEFREQLERFRAAGYEVWMDDFGSGYSSLNLLKDYRFDTLKIDMAFLASFESNPKSREIIVTVVDMAKKLGIRTLIEGVETKAQYRFLQRIGCEMLQGFYFDKPRPYDEREFGEYAMENAAESAYFDALGSVNLLGLPTGGEHDAAAGYVTESESRSMPMALVEYRGGSYGYLSANEAYLKLLEGVAARTLDELQEAMSAGAYRIPAALADALDEARTRGGEASRDFSIGGEEHQVRIRHVATGPDAHAYVITPLLDA